MKVFRSPDPSVFLSVNTHRYPPGEQPPFPHSDQGEDSLSLSTPRSTPVILFYLTTTRKELMIFFRSCSDLLHCFSLAPMVAIMT